MKLTTADVTRLIGGQMERQNSRDGYIYRGEISTIAIVNNKLTVRLSWNAKGEGFPPIPQQWVEDKNITFSTSLNLYTVSNIGPSGGDIGGGDRLCLNCPTTGEMIVLYPPDGSKLDPAKIINPEQIP